MSARAAIALTRASWRTAKSYRVLFVLSFVSLIVTIIPVYFVATALQPFMASVIAEEGREYFGFVLLGTAVIAIISPALSSFAASVSGFFEALIATPTSLPSLFAGQTGYAFVWAFARVFLLMIAGVSLGVDLRWMRLPEALLILAITIAAYVGIGLVAAALVIAVRTNAAIPQAVLLASTILGGVYFPTNVLPPAVVPIAEWVPLTPGLRALRRTLLLGYPLGSVSGDLMRVAGLALVASVVGAASLRWALGYARRAGSLSQY